ncbi:hypothetical protein BLNAU_18754 [Blattamonas nauphoetae]|uniref:Uncharacterized protein n=1 Tax=Blattamonas nauphoetae TaxID=2049346 RepID=A0ABQ9X3G9_9EUKA|nr:hypothetical protein BLNAU_18754 [Blattamonas nauphoetae]
MLVPLLVSIASGLTHIRNDVIFYEGFDFKDEDRAEMLRFINPTQEIHFKTCTFTSIIAQTEAGGAILCQNTSMDFTLEGSTFTSCSSSQMSGGALSYSASKDTCKLTITKCQFVSCSAKQNGGALFLDFTNMNGRIITVSSNTFGTEDSANHCDGYGDNIYASSPTLATQSLQIDWTDTIPNNEGIVFTTEQKELYWADDTIADMSLLFFVYPYDQQIMFCSQTEGSDNLYCGLSVLPCQTIEIASAQAKGPMRVVIGSDNTIETTYHPPKPVFTLWSEMRPTLSFTKQAQIYVDNEQQQSTYCTIHNFNFVVETNTPVTTPFILVDAGKLIFDDIDFEAKAGQTEFPRIFLQTTGGSVIISSSSLSCLTSGAPTLLINKGFVEVSGSNFFNNPSEISLKTSVISISSGFITLSHNIFQRTTFSGESFIKCTGDGTVQIIRSDADSLTSTESGAFLHAHNTHTATDHMRIALYGTTLSNCVSTGDQTKGGALYCCGNATFRLNGVTMDANACGRGGQGTSLYIESQSGWNAYGISLMTLCFADDAHKTDHKIYVKGQSLDKAISGRWSGAFTYTENLGYDDFNTIWGEDTMNPEASGPLVYYQYPYTSGNIFVNDKYWDRKGCGQKQLPCKSLDSALSAIKVSGYSDPATCYIATDTTMNVELTIKLATMIMKGKDNDHTFVEVGPQAHFFVPVDAGMVSKLTLHSLDFSFSDQASRTKPWVEINKNDFEIVMCDFCRSTELLLTNHPLLSLSDTTCTISTVSFHHISSGNVGVLSAKSSTIEVDNVQITGVDYNQNDEPEICSWDSSFFIVENSSLSLVQTTVEDYTEGAIRATQSKITLEGSFFQTKQHDKTFPSLQHIIHATRSSEVQVINTGRHPDMNPPFWFKLDDTSKFEVSGATQHPPFFTPTITEVKAKKTSKLTINLNGTLLIPCQLQIAIVCVDADGTSGKQIVVPIVASEWTEETINKIVIEKPALKSLDSSKNWTAKIVFGPNLEFSTDSFQVYDAKKSAFAKVVWVIPFVVVVVLGAAAVLIVLLCVRKRRTGPFKYKAINDNNSIEDKS